MILSNNIIFRIHKQIVKTNEKLEEAIYEGSRLKKAFALEYGPTLRAMCRAEKQRKNANFKRITANRFYHYFRSININLKNNTLNSLCECLC